MHLQPTYRWYLLSFFLVLWIAALAMFVYMSSADRTTAISAVPLITLLALSYLLFSFWNQRVILTATGLSLRWFSCRSVSWADIKSLQEASELGFRYIRVTTAQGRHFNLPVPMDAPPFRESDFDRKLSLIREHQVRHTSP